MVIRATTSAGRRRRRRRQRQRQRRRRSRDARALVSRTRLQARPTQLSRTLLTLVALLDSLYSVRTSQLQHKSQSARRQAD